MSSQTRKPENVSGGLCILLYLGAAAVSFFLGLSRALGLPCEQCGGGVATAVLPWIGAVGYSGLALAAWLRPEAPGIAAVVGLTVFAHADLILESAGMHRWCWVCIAVASLVWSAAAVRTLRFRSERVLQTASFILGCAAGLLSPFERIDDAATRAVWPARLVEGLPEFVLRNQVFSCEHDRPVRVLVFERYCVACSSLLRRLERLDAENAGKVCLHPHSIPFPPDGVSLPLLVLVSKDRRVLAFEGHPTIREVDEFVHSMIEGRQPRGGR